MRKPPRRELVEHAGEKLVNSLDKEIEALTLKAYDSGFQDALASYAIWRDGEQWVGDPGRSLREAIDDFRQTWNYNPPRIEE